MCVHQSQKVVLVSSKLFRVFLTFTLLVAMWPLIFDKTVALAEDSDAQGTEAEVVVNGRVKTPDEVSAESASGGIVELIDRSSIEYNKSKAASLSNTRKSNSNATSLPDKVDLRDISNYVTSVKNQGNTGTCWAWASVAAMETAVAKAKNISAQDLSAYQLSYFAYTPLSTNTSDLKGTEVSQAGEGRYPDSSYSSYILDFGGQSTLSPGLFMQGTGAVSSSTIPFPASALARKTITSADALSCAQRRLKEIKMTNWNNLGSLITTSVSSTQSGTSTTYVETDETVLNNIKSQLASKNAVVINFHSDNNNDASKDVYFNHATNAQYTYEYKGADHSVCIVGYDDTYSKDNFLVGHEPEKDGAFIVKNSWGTGWGDSGYFYLSYYDKSITTASSYEVSAEDASDEIVDQYDYTQPGYFVSVTSEWYSNIYTASQKQQLTSIGTYVGEDVSTLKYKVYKLKSGATSPNDVENSLSNPDAEGSCTPNYEGFITINLDDPVNLQKGDKYAIWFSQETTDSYYSPVSVSPGRSYLSSEHLATTSIINAGESFRSDDLGKTWSEWTYTGSSYSTYDNYCVKGYSKPADNLAFVTFNSNGGSSVKSKAVKNGGYTQAPSAPEREGYAFVGWYTDEDLQNEFDFSSTPVNSDITLYAKWKYTGNYEISYAGVEGATNNNPTSYKADSDTITLSDPAKTGYTFVGWTTDDVKTPTKNLKIEKGSSGNKTFTANWQINKYSVAFKSNGGTFVSSQNVEYNKTASKPANPTRVGYTFVGWYTDSACTNAFNFSTKITKNTTLYAKWTKNATPVTVKKIVMFRLYNKYTGEHFYTSNTQEKGSLVKAGWNYEGVGWNAPGTSTTPVYRLYNKWVSGGDHHYTTNKSERDSLIKAGWTSEGVGWYSDDSKGVALYRQYNPFATTGTHNYTTSKAENDKLVSLGWKSEGISWYGIK